MRLSITILLLFFLSTNSLLSNGNQTDTIQDYLRDKIEIAWELSNKNIDSSLRIVDAGLTLATTHKLVNEEAELYRIKGVIYFYKVDYLQAFNLFIKSRDLYRQTNNKKGEASALGNITLIYDNQGLYKKSLEVDLEVLKLREELGDSLEIAKSYNNLGVTYKNLGQFDKTLAYYQKAVQIIKSLNRIESLDLYYNNIGDILMLQNKPDSALIYFKKGLYVGQKLGNTQIVGNSFAYIGDYYFFKEKYQKAIENYQQSLKLAQKTGIVYEIEASAEKLHKAYANTERYKEAYEMHKLYKMMVDSANDIEITKKITEIEASTKYAKEKELEQAIVAKKDAESKLELSRQKQLRNLAVVLVLISAIWMFFLYKSNKKKTKLNQELTKHRDQILIQKEEIESQRDRIEEMNKMKDKFLTIIAHDLKNPLGGILQFAEMLVDDFKTIEKQALEKYIGLISLSAKNTYELLENLLQWAMSQSNSIQINAIEFDLKEVISENIELLKNNANQKNITLNLPDGDSFLAKADIKMVKTVVRNLLHNAIKFSPADGSIDFKLRKVDNFWEVSVKDKGIGLSEQEKEAIFDFSKRRKEIGKSSEKGTGLGLLLCKEFTEQNGGKIWVESVQNMGSTFFFTVPAAT